MGLFALVFDCGTAQHHLRTCLETSQKFRTPLRIDTAAKRPRYPLAVSIAGQEADLPPDALSSLPALLRLQFPLPTPQAPRSN